VQVCKFWSIRKVYDIDMNLVITKSITDAFYTTVNIFCLC
jgi:hypothetical protein